MKILVTGNYNPDYNRTKIIIEGLQRRSDVDIFKHPYNSRKSVNINELKNKCDQSDFVFLPSFTHPDVKFIKKLTKTPIVFDPLISRYLTKVFDYKQVSRFSPRAYKNFIKDKIALCNADIILSDTNAHTDYYVSKFGADKRKFHTVRVGVPNNAIKAVPQQLSDIKSKFTVGFYGAFNPLQGVPVIIETANLMKNNTDIIFDIVGEGFDYKKVIALVKKLGVENVNFHGRLTYTELLSKIANFDVCLGIFGESLKADLVIPNKVYDYAAARKAIITKDTIGIREVFTHEENILLVKNNPEEIKNAIIKLKNNQLLTTLIANNAHQLVCNNFNEDKIADSFMKALQKM